MNNIKLKVDNNFVYSRSLYCSACYTRPTSVKIRLQVLKFMVVFLLAVGSAVGVLDCVRECTCGQSMVGPILWKCSEDYLTYYYSVVPVVKLAPTTAHD